LNPKKTPSYVFIANEILQKLPEIGIKFIISNSVLKYSNGLLSTPMKASANYYDPEAWKIYRT